tara:strand:+ start:963 stop:1766 length:804 start_codon:yes stop_codon:yes gene_type:complete
MKTIMLTNDTDLSRYFCSKLAGDLKIKKIFIIEQNKDIKNSRNKLKKLLITLISKKFFEKLIGFKNFLFDKEYYQISKLEKKIQKEKLSFYFKDYLKVLSTDLMIFEKINLHSTDFVNRLYKIKPDLMLLFGTPIIDERIFNIPKYGTINFHSSMLPYYKGSMVEFWQLYNSDYRYCGVSIHFVDKNVDSGNIIIQEQINVDNRDVFFDLRYKNLLKGLELYPAAIDKVKNGYKGEPQIKIKQKPFSGKMVTSKHILELYKRKGYLE